MREILLGKTPSELKEAALKAGLPSYAGKQLAQWIYARRVRSFDEMTNISKAGREKLKEMYDLGVVLPSACQESSDGTRKYLFPVGEGNAVEAVMIPDDDRKTLCVSSQAGCRMGCRFCMTGRQGFHGNLSVSLILSQFIAIDESAGLTNAVFMGMGEPLDNFDNVIRFLRLVNHPDGENIGMRHISLSTCGLTERFDELADLNLQLTLSVSLHAPDDETRSRIMPANRGRGVEQLISACSRYYEKTGRRISFEYAMIDGVNDTPYHAKLLAQHAKRVCAHVNLIPLNHVEERQFAPSTPEHMKAFIRILEEAGVNVTVRRRLGSDVDASCGQLRKKVAENRA